jgi:restriction system protein
MSTFYRVRLGKGAALYSECVLKNYVGVGYGIDLDLTEELTDNFQDFNQKYIPVYLANRPDRSKITAGLACGAIWTVACGMAEGDILVTSDGNEGYHACKVVGGYHYAAGTPLLHRRSVEWLPVTFNKNDASDPLRKALQVPHTVICIDHYAAELERLLRGEPSPLSMAHSETANAYLTPNDSLCFPLEKELENFIVNNWQHVEFGQDFDIFTDEDGETGQQYQADKAGIIDILAVSKDRKRLLVIELKKGSTSDATVGQMLRYMGYVKEVLADEDQTVFGAIVALDDDKKIQWALSMVENVAFYRYEMTFKLVKK